MIFTLCTASAISGSSADFVISSRLPAATTLRQPRSVLSYVTDETSLSSSMTPFFRRSLDRRPAGSRNSGLVETLSKWEDSTVVLNTERELVSDVPGLSVTYRDCNHYSVRAVWPGSGCLATAPGSPRGAAPRRLSGEGGRRHRSPDRWRRPPARVSRRGRRPGRRN